MRSYPGLAPPSSYHLPHSCNLPSATSPLTHCYFCTICLHDIATNDEERRNNNEERTRRRPRVASCIFFRHLPSTIYHRHIPIPRPTRVILPPTHFFFSFFILRYLVHLIYFPFLYHPSPSPSSIYHRPPAVHRLVSSLFLVTVTASRIHPSLVSFTRRPVSPTPHLLSPVYHLPSLPHITASSIPFPLILLHRPPFP